MNNKFLILFINISLIIFIVPQTVFADDFDKFKITIDNGTIINPSINEEYSANNKVYIKANKAQDGKHFLCWKSDEIVFEDEYSETTCFIMESKNVKVEAVYVDCDFNRKIVSEEYLVAKSSCEKPAKYYKSCVCGVHSKTETFYYCQHKHEFNIWNIVKESTCTENGVKEHVCCKCGYKEKQSIDAKGHNWESAYTIDKEPTKTELGYKSIHCKSCSATKDKKEILKLNFFVGKNFDKKEREYIDENDLIDMRELISKEDLADVEEIIAEGDLVRKKDRNSKNTSFNTGDDDYIFLPLLFILSSSFAILTYTKVKE